jgi:hypothetical protein
MKEWILRILFIICVVLICLYAIPAVVALLFGLLGLIPPLAGVKQFEPPVVVLLQCAVALWAVYTLFRGGWPFPPAP